MGYLIEEARNGRSSCRTCKKPIARVELRLGEEVPNAFGAGEVTHRWHHLPCAAKKKPLVLEAALATTTLPVPARAAPEADIAANKKNQKPAAWPCAERAKTSRSTCLQYDESIEKGTLRVAVAREVDTGAFVTTGSGDLRAACAPEWHEANAPVEGDLAETIEKNSTALDPGDLAALELELGA